MSIFNKKRFTFSKGKRKTAPDSNETNDDGSKSKDGSDEDDHLPSIEDEVIYPPLVEGQMPTFFHIGGLAKECLITGYKIGAWHIDCTTKANDSISFYSSGSGRPGFENVMGGVGVVEKWGAFNASQVWQTEGILATLGYQTILRGGLIDGKLRATYASNSSTGVKLELYSGYDHAPIKFQVIMPILNEPKLMGYMVLAPAKNYILGFRAVFDINDMGFDKHALGVGFNNGNTEVGLKLENFRDVRGSLFQRIGERWAVALKANLYSEDEKKFAIGGQYQITENALLKARLRNDGILGLVYKHNLSEHIHIMYHVGLDASAPISGEHKLGLSWSLKS